jgi:hypothetical protein
MESIQDYFGRHDTPAAGSPVGLLMVKVIEKNPSVGFEEARKQANALLDKAATKKIYRIPTVYSPEEKAKWLERMRASKALPLAA